MKQWPHQPGFLLSIAWIGFGCWHPAAGCLVLADRKAPGPVFVSARLLEVNNFPTSVFRLHLLFYLFFNCSPLLPDCPPVQSFHCPIAQPRSQPHNKTWLRHGRGSKREKHSSKINDLWHPCPFVAVGEQAKAIIHFDRIFTAPPPLPSPP